MKQAKRLDRLSASAWYLISESYYKRITDFIKKAERNPDLLNTTKNLPADYGAISVMAEMLTKSYLMGLDRSTRKMEFAEPTAEEIETLPYAEAVEYLKKRDVLTKVDYKKLTAQLKFRAFTASRISDGALLKRINGELIKSIESGEGLKAFLEMTKTDLLNKVGLGNAGGWYWETVYRTNVQTAYNAGRMMGYEQDKPYALELVVIDDARTTDYCRQYAGKGFILPYSDPFWRTHIPPFHFNCRTTIRAIYDQDELPESWSSKTDLARPAKGFGKNPVMNDDWWKELDSQVRQAKMYGVQGEIEAAEEKLIENIDLNDDGFIPSENIESANKYAQETLGILHADYKGCSIEAANEWNKGLYENFKKFPELKDRINFVGECHERNKAMKEKFFEIKTEQYLEKLRTLNPGVPDTTLQPYADKKVASEWKKISRNFKVSKTTIAQSYSSSSDLGKEFAGITVNKDVVKNYDNYLLNAERDVKIKFHPVGTASLKADLDHEIGHQLDAMLDIENDNVIVKLWKSLTPNEITEGLSEYAWNNSSPQPIEEFIAEAWSEYCNNPSPRFIAKTVGDRILEVYKAWKK